MPEPETSRSAGHPVRQESHPGYLPPIEMSVDVACSVDRAFRLFTEDIDSWWPLATHSCGQAETASCSFEPFVGGRLCERLHSGEEQIWGEVLVFDSPRRVVFTWHPGREPETAQEVELRFFAAGDVTRVELVHRGWERFGEGAAEMHGEYVTGWGFVLGERFAAAVTA